VAILGLAMPLPESKVDNRIAAFSEIPVFEAEASAQPPGLHPNLSGQPSFKLLQQRTPSRFQHRAAHFTPPAPLLQKTHDISHPFVYKISTAKPNDIYSLKEFSHVQLRRSKKRHQTDDRQ
jgi:hypothetical protein